MEEQARLGELAEFFKVLGDPTRIRILSLLAEGERCVCDLAEQLGLTQPAVSYQLKTLKQSRLVKNRREGKTIYYLLDDSHVAGIIGLAKEHLEEKR